MKKICTRCKVEKLLTRFSKRKNLNKTTTIYWNSICIDCLSVAMTKWRKENKERFAEYQRNYQRRARNQAKETLSKL